MPSVPFHVLFTFNPAHSNPFFLLNSLNRIASRELQREKVWSRLHLVPLLLAEGDRDAYRRQQAAVAREREIMKDVPGWEVRSLLPFCLFLANKRSLG